MPLDRGHSGTYAAFAGAVLIGGANFVAVSFSNLEMPPLFGAALRFGLAAALFLLIRRVGDVGWPARREVRGAALYGVLGFGVAYACIYYALLGLTAGTAAVVLASVPLLTLLTAVGLRQERLTGRGIAGGVLALAGIAVLSAETLGGELRGRYLVAALGAAVASALSSVIAKAYPRVHPLNMNLIGMLAGTAFLTLGSLVLREGWSLPVELRSWLALGWLVIAGSVGLFQLFLFVMRRWSASATVYVLAGMPVVAAALGALLLQQPITPHFLLGALLVSLAVYVGAVSRRPAPQPPPSGD